MNTYKADLHIHTLLSPCGSLDMSPIAIVNEALNKGIQIIGITDHNSTLQSPLVQQIGAERGLFVLCGAEVTSREEVHCLTYFSNLEKLKLFQNYIDEYLPFVQNNTDYFGYQVLVDGDENIVYTEERLLISAINQSVEQISEEVYKLDGIFVLAHVDKTKNSIISQLGFFPNDLKVDGIELTKKGIDGDFVHKHNSLSALTQILNSDAHFIEDIGKGTSSFIIEDLCFDEIKMAFKFENQRKLFVN